MFPVFVEILIKIAVVFGGLMTAAAYLVLLERRVAAWVQDRRGPNRVGIPLTRMRLFGLGQPLADGLKFMTKEDLLPTHVDKFLFFVAPLAIFVAATAAFAVVPFGSVLPLRIAAPGVERPLSLIIAPGLDVGLIYIAALGSLAVYGVILGGWSSNNKYGFLGALRASAQLIAYELPVGAGILGVALATGSLRLDAVIAQQAVAGIWNGITQPLGMLVFVVASVAEAGRLPFDLTECEQELVGGYHTEYSGMKLMLFLVAEFLHLTLAAFLIVILYLGGWHFWGLSGAGNTVTWPVALLRIAILAVKVLWVIFCFMIVRWSWPRFRFDQLMGLAWNVMLPLGIVNVVMVAVWIEYGDRMARAIGLSRSLAESLLGWLVLVGVWLVATLVVPASSDNRPRREMAEAPAAAGKEIRA
jgi:NADH-quinone oxidoreductase subunit H